MKTSPAHHFVRVNGVRLHYVEAGAGPSVVLLHGFPDFWYGWRHQIRDLASAGYRVLAPDLRGYNLSDKPAGTRSYQLKVLIDDVCDFIHAVEAEQAALVGHDWGGFIAWYVAMHRPGALRRVVILNAAHPVAYARELRDFSMQIVRSWYVLFFQIPWLPEHLLRAGNFALLRREWRRGPAQTDDEISRYVRAFKQPGALASAINYYRAALWDEHPSVTTIRLPSLVIWGEQDRFQTSRLADGLDEWVADLRVERIPQAGHWLHHSDAKLINDLLKTFLAEDGTR